MRGSTKWGGLVATNHRAQLFFFKAAAGPVTVTCNRYDLNSDKGWNPVIGETVPFVINVVAPQNSTLSTPVLTPNDGSNY